jgi:hypothetical protein
VFRNDTPRRVGGGSPRLTVGHPGGAWCRSAGWRVPPGGVGGLARGVRPGENPRAVRAVRAVVSETFGRRVGRSGRSGGCFRNFRATGRAVWAVGRLFPKLSGDGSGGPGGCPYFRAGRGGSEAAFTSASTPARIAGGRSGHAATTAANSGSAGVASAIARRSGSGVPGRAFAGSDLRESAPDSAPPGSETLVFSEDSGGCSGPALPIGPLCTGAHRLSPREPPEIQQGVSKAIRRKMWCEFARLRVLPNLWLFSRFLFSMLAAIVDQLRQPL